MGTTLSSMTFIYFLNLEQQIFSKTVCPDKTETAALLQGKTVGLSEQR